MQGTALADDAERVGSRIREAIEPELVDRMREKGIRTRFRDILRERVETAVRERIGEAFRAVAEEQRGRQPDPERAITMVGERLMDAIEQRLGETLKERLFEVVRDRFEEVGGPRLGMALRSATAQRMHAFRDSGESFVPATPWGMGDGMPLAATHRDQIHEAIRDRLGDAIRERLASTIEQSIGDALRERLSTAIQATLVEQKLLGGFDPEQFADGVRGLLDHAIRERVIDAVRERLHEVHREHLHDVIRNAAPGSRQEFTGFGTGMH